MFGFIVLFVIQTAFAQAPTSSTPTPCCIGHKFMSNMYGFGGNVIGSTVTPVTLFAKLFYDYDTRMIRTEDLLDGSVSFSDFKSHQGYSISNGRCVSFTVNTTLPEPCVPHNANFIGSYELGSNSSVLVNAWRVVVNTSEHNQYVVKITVTDDHCTPIEYSTYGTINGVQTAVTYFYTDYTENAVTAGVMDIPPECTHSVNPGGLIGKRSLPFGITL